jgi:pilus assembly protein Flp/PilA
MDKLIRFFKEEEGATAVEYGVMVAAIIAAVIVIVFAIGGKISTAFQNVSTALNAQVPG